jgi:hypothetical protein
MCALSRAPSGSALVHLPMRRAGIGKRRTTRHATGTTNIERTSAVVIPPIIGPAMRRMTSDPVPLLHMMGNKPAMTTEAVIMIGRTRSAAPSTMASASVCSSASVPAALRASIAELIYTSMTTPISDATPASAMKPTADAIDMS